jgi:hypothetical protein
VLFIFYPPEKAGFFVHFFVRFFCVCKRRTKAQWAFETGCVMVPKKSRVNYFFHFLCAQKVEQKRHHERQLKVCPFRTGSALQGPITFCSHRSWKASAPSYSKKNEKLNLLLADKKLRRQSPENGDSTEYKKLNLAVPILIVYFYIRNPFKLRTIQLTSFFPIQ